MVETVATRDGSLYCPAPLLSPPSHLVQRASSYVLHDDG